MELIRMAWRGIWRTTRRTVITMLSIGLGLALVIIFISFGDGVYYQLVDDAANMQAGHITIENPGYRDSPSVDQWVDETDEIKRRAEALPNVKMVKRLIVGNGVASTGSNSVGIAIMGIEPALESTVSPIPDNIIKGEYLEDADGEKALIGSRLARLLDLKPGRKLVLTVNNSSGDMVQVLFRVKGIFETGTDEIDGYLMQIPLNSATGLFGLPDNAATQVGVVVDQSTRQKETFDHTTNEFKELPVAVLTWQSIMPDLAAYITLDKSSNIIMQGILMFLVLFTIFNTILMSVLERRREFAVLLAIGTPPGMLKWRVVIESFFIGIIGCAAGLAVGWGFSAWTGVRGLDMSGFLGSDLDVSGFAVSLIIHPISTAPTLLWPVLLILASTIVISAFCVRRVGGEDIPDILRHN
ncbi:MAG: ABC transporter permease [bacterium]